MQYPRIVKLDNPKLKDLILQKNDLVLSGRKIAEEIDLLGGSMKETENKLIAEESKVDVSELRAELKAKAKLITDIMVEAQAIEKEIYKKIKANTPQELRDEYDALAKEKEEKERELNKIGHKVQKVKDKIIPLVHKIGKPYLEDEFEDFSTTKLDKNNEPYIEIYSKLEEWKALQRNK